MGNGRKIGIVLAVTLTIAVAFVVIGVLFLRESVQNAVNYAESEDELYAMGLSSELESYMSRQYALVGSALLDQNFQDAVSMEEAAEPEQKVAAAVAPKLSYLTNIWVGLNGLLPREQTLYAIRYDEDFGLYMLTVDSAHAIFNEMRARSSTLLLALAVVMLLLLFMVVGIVRWYRSRLVRAITTDELTGLANRKSFAH